MCLTNCVAISLSLHIAIGLYFWLRPPVFEMNANLEQPLIISIEFVAPPAAEMAPTPEVTTISQIAQASASEPESEQGTDLASEQGSAITPEPETELEPEPITVDPKVKTNAQIIQKLPKPQPKKQNKAKTESTELLESQQESAPAAAAVAAPQPSAVNSFIAQFRITVEKNKYYPKSARRAGITGIVKIRVTFNTQGYIAGAHLVPGDYPAELGQGALTTIERVKDKWKPHGPGPSSLVIPLIYHLN